MTTSEQVLAAISRLASSESKRPLLVCIDGFGGSGRSTLADLIRRAPEVSAVVEGDDFWAELTRSGQSGRPQLSGSGS